MAASGTAAPVDAATELGADVIVAVELGHPYTLPERLREPAARVARTLERAPLHRTIAGLPFTIHAAASALKPGRTAHVVLRPPMGLRAASVFGMIDCLDAGIAAAQEALPAIRALLAGEAPRAVAAEYAPASVLTHATPPDLPAVSEAERKRPRPCATSEP